MKLLVTGGAGFIGSALVRHLLAATPHRVVNVDKLTYAGNLESLSRIGNDPRHVFLQADIGDRARMDAILREHRPDAIVNLAAESHVDRSIDGPGDFIATNVVGAYCLLEAARAYWSGLAEPAREAFRFHHVSTDEVFGDLEPQDPPFSEASSYRPSSPYSASKAASDHLVRAWRRTYGLPTMVSNCSNNYGPCQFPEKLIPHMVLNALAGRQLPVYGDGLQIRDWLHVDDHARALVCVLERGAPGETYNIGGLNEVRNIDVVHAICDLLEEMAGDRKPQGLARYRDLVTFVRDRPGHDTRYAINAAKIERELGWRPAETFASGLRKTIAWYLDNEAWWRRVLDGSYRLERAGVFA